MEGYTKKRKVSCEMNFSKIDSSVMCHTVLHLWKGAKSQAPVLSRFLEEHPWLEINLAFFPMDKEKLFMRIIRMHFVTKKNNSKKKRVRGKIS